LGEMHKEEVLIGFKFLTVNFRGKIKENRGNIYDKQQQQVEYWKLLPAIMCL
jgi:hypothetical protein